MIFVGVVAECVRVIVYVCGRRCPRLFYSRFDLKHNGLPDVRSLGRHTWKSLQRR